MRDFFQFIPKIRGHNLAFCFLSFLTLCFLSFTQSYALPPTLEPTLLHCILFLRSSTEALAELPRSSELKSAVPATVPFWVCRSCLPALTSDSLSERFRSWRPAPPNPKALCSVTRAGFSTRVTDSSFSARFGSHCSRYGTVLALRVAWAVLGRLRAPPQNRLAVTGLVYLLEK